MVQTMRELEKQKILEKLHERRYFNESDNVKVTKIKTKNHTIRYIYIVKAFFNRNRIDVNEIINNGSEGFN